jgi:predicted nucleic acid-binding protein
VVIIDTSVWIPALEKKSSAERTEVGRLVEQGQAAIVGIVLTEVLRGARNRSAFEELRYQLLAAAYLDEEEGTWTLAAEVLLDLKLKGQTIPLPDAVIAAHALQGGHSVYTHDEHFERIADLRLHEVAR